MKKKLHIYILIVIGIFIMNSRANAQIDSITNLCAQHINPPYISDGQNYIALLNVDEIAEFYATFYGESRYRIAVCSGLAEEELTFSVYDQERNLLFTNRDYDHTPYWDFTFNSTMDCIIEAEINSKKLTSGFVLMYIGFKR